MTISFSYNSCAKIMLLSIIWYIEFCVRFFQVPGGLLVLGAALGVFVFLDYFSGGKQLVKCNGILVAFVIYLLYTLIFGAAATYDLSRHINQGISMVEYTLVLFATYYLIVKDQSIDFLVWNYAILYAIMCVIFIVSPVYYKDNLSYERLSFAKMMNPNNFAMCMAMGTWAVLYLASKKKLPLFIALTVSMLQLYAIFMSGSRKGLIGILTIMVLWVLFCYLPNTKDKNWLKTIGRIVLVFAVVLVMVSVVMPYYLNSNLASRMDNLIQEATEGARNEMYRMGWEYFARSPLVGYGLQGFSYFYGGYSHATVVEVPVSGGILGTFMFLVFVGLIAYGLYIGLRHTKLYPVTTEGFVNPRMGFVLFVVMIFYSVALIHIYEISSYYYFGLLAAIVELDKKHYSKIGDYANA